MGACGTETTHLAESLCARLCHDMAGPLGTVTGALDLAAEDPDSTLESLQLAREAATQMVQRLRLSRAAWAGDCGALDVPGLMELAKGLPPRVHLDTGGLSGRFAAPVARTLLNMMLLGMDALPRGGRIALSGTPGADVLLMVAGPQAAWPAGLALALADPLATPLDDPREIQAPLVALLAQEAGLRVSLLFASGAHDGVPPLLLGAP
jgi:histidine phosphotransferase ChpT